MVLVEDAGCARGHDSGESYQEMQEAIPIRGWNVRRRFGDRAWPAQAEAHPATPPWVRNGGCQTGGLYPRLPEVQTPECSLPLQGVLLAPRTTWPHTLMQSRGDGFPDSRAGMQVPRVGTNAIH